MTLDEAIIYEVKLASIQNCESCREDHFKIAEWLTKLNAMEDKLERKKKIRKYKNEVKCPSCTRELSTYESDKQAHCKFCGQALDWKVEE